MGFNMFWFIVLNIIAAATLCICLVIWIYNYKKRNELPSEQKIWQNSLSGGGIALVICTYPIFYWITDIKEAIELLLRVIPIIMGGIAFVIAFLNFQRKSFALNKDGVGNLIYTAHFHKYNWNHQFYIINLKDRSVVVYEVVLKFKNISVVLPFDYPINLGGYGATGITMNYLDAFISRRPHYGIFEVKNADNEFSRFMDGFHESEFSGDRILKELASSRFTVHATTNIRKEPILLLEQGIGVISKNSIHIDEVRFSDKSAIEEQIMDHPDIDLKHLNLIDQGEGFTVQKSDRYY